MQIIKSICSAAALLTLSTVASYSADVEHGRDLAERWCASAMLFRRTSKALGVPPFATIAQSLNFDPKRLAYFLLEPHPKMPQMALSRSAADDIAAYIQSLKR